MTAGRRPRRFGAIRFGAREDGGATAFGLIAISLMLLFAGLAIDVANLYRHQTLLQLTADSAAQAGVVTLARGGTAPDARKAAGGMVETNMPEAQDHVARLVAGFLDPQITLPEELTFFASRRVAGDPEALREVGLRGDDTRPGDVLQMTPLQFSQMRERPSGLVYAVHCNTAKNDRRPLWERTLTLTGTEGAPTLRDLVLVTDCAIEMDDLVRIEGALLLLTGPQGAQISALPGATLGDPEAACDAARRVRLMAFGDLVLPADLARGNISVVAGGDIRLADDPDQKRIAHQGLILHAGGRVTAEGSHSFARCPAETRSDPLMPAMQVIAHVMPPLGDVLTAPEQARPVQTELPGQAADRLPGDAAERRPMEGGDETGS